MFRLNVNNELFLFAQKCKSTCFAYIIHTFSKAVHVHYTHVLCLSGFEFGFEFELILFHNRTPLCM